MIAIYKNEDEMYGSLKSKSVIFVLIMKDIVQHKKELRTQLFSQRNALAFSVKEIYDASICAKLEQIILERNCKVVHAYLPMGSEIDIKPLIQRLLNLKIKVVSPKTLKNRKLQHLVLHSLEEIESGVYGTSHPSNSTDYSGNYDVIIVPGLAFDSNNYRLGYGGGYYDAFLVQNPNAFAIGICYPFQKLEKIPKELHDVKLQQVLLNKIEKIP